MCFYTCTAKFGIEFCKNQNWKFLSSCTGVQTFHLPRTKYSLLRLSVFTQQVESWLNLLKIRTVSIHFYSLITDPANIFYSMIFKCLCFFMLVNLLFGLMCFCLFHTYMVWQNIFESIYGVQGEYKFCVLPKF